MTCLIACIVTVLVLAGSTTFALQGCPDVTKQRIGDVVLAYSERLASGIIANKDISLKSPALATFITQDLNYLINYQSWVPALSSSGGCGGEPIPCAVKYAANVSSRVAFSTGDVQDYEKLFEMQQGPMNAALQAYANFYQHQSTCQDVVSSMVVCLCSYSLLAQRMQKELDNGGFAGWSAHDLLSIKAFIEYNGSADPLLEGTACALARATLDTLALPYATTLLEAALQRELTLWGVDGIARSDL